jgi:hypothetical protein
MLHCAYPSVLHCSILDVCCNISFTPSLESKISNGGAECSLSGGSSIYGPHNTVSWIWTIAGHSVTCCFRQVSHRLQRHFNRLLKCPLHLHDSRRIGLMTAPAEPPSMSQLTAFSTCMGSLSPIAEQSPGHMDARLPGGQAEQWLPQDGNGAPHGDGTPMLYQHGRPAMPTAPARRTSARWPPWRGATTPHARDTTRWSAQALP